MAPFLEVVFNMPLRRAFLYSAGEAGEVEIGQRVRAPFRSTERLGVVVGMRATAPPAIRIKSIAKIVDSRPLYNAELLELGRWMADYYCCSLGEALLMMIPNVRPRFTVSAEEQAEEQAEEEQEDEQEDAEQGDEGREDIVAEEMGDASDAGAGQAGGDIALTAHQQNALETICRSDDSLLYLHGVTGSGKSELLLRIAQRNIAEGRGTILLVPEISLAFQMASAIAARYGMEYAILHSRLSNAERMRQWVRIIEGKARLVIGARSAVFAPLPNIGMIIIDEEQDGAYKSSFTPRYHARHIAMRRAARHGAKVLFCSATPSLEAWHHMRSGRITGISLPHRVAGARHPRMEIVDMRMQRGIISATLAEEIVKVVGAGKQAILLHNRRGYGRTLMCSNCGYTQECPHCSVAMIYHRELEQMVCHYCAATETKQSACPTCRALEITFSSFGTERVEQELRRMFPRFRIARIDTDTVRKRDTLSEMLASFRNREIDILIGTQIVAKGLNFPDVELVGIVLADSLLTLPDFRAEERAFMLLTQVAGRAGRFSEEGRVIIQTYRADNIAIRAAHECDLEGYYRFELDQRQAVGFPPYSRMIRIVTRSKSERNALLLAERAHAALARHRPAPQQLYGPIPCAIAKISNHYRYQLMIGDPSFSVVHRAVADTVDALASLSATYLEVDIDPIRVL